MPSTYMIRKVHQEDVTELVQLRWDSRASEHLAQL